MATDRAVVDADGRNAVVGAKADADEAIQSRAPSK